MRTMLAWRRRMPSLASPKGRRRAGRRRAPDVAAPLVLGLTLMLLAGCGGSVAQPMPTATVARQPPTPAAGGFATFFSRVDYPLEIPVNGADTVTLTLSSEQNLLTITPTPGGGSAPLGVPFALPTDLGRYRDIGVTAGLAGTDGPLLWQPLTAMQQSLLTPPQPNVVRAYVSRAVFRWQIRALSAGPNRASISLDLYYISLDGAVERGSIEVSAAPIPILAIQPTPANTTLPLLQLPLIGIVGTVGALGILSFLWSILQSLISAAGSVRDVRDLLSRGRGRKKRTPNDPSGPTRRSGGRRVSSEGSADSNEG